MMKSPKLKLITIAIMSFFTLTSASDLKRQKIFKERYKAYVTRVHDGDSFIAEIPDLPPIIGENIIIRIDHIDTPELNDKRYTIKQAALLAKKELTQLLQNAQHVEVLNLKRDKYFRILADVLVDGKDVGKALLAKGIARPYDGGHKTPW